jgi:NAD(P) transhydrogenase
VIIGSGPAGQKAAIQAAKLGNSVIVVEQDKHAGGVSLNSGTIPSKSLREAILDLTDFYRRSFYGRQAESGATSINDLNFRLYKILEEQRKNLYRQFEKNKIVLIHGTARFENPHQILVVDEKEQAMCQIKGSVFLIATGSRPRNPLDIPFDGKVVLDSTRLLSIDHVPNTLLVLGGGIIGSEYASFFAALGT